MIFATKHFSRCVNNIRSRVWILLFEISIGQSIVKIVNGNVSPLFQDDVPFDQPWDDPLNAEMMSS